MKVLFPVALVILTVAVSAKPARRQIGICVEECSPNTSGGSILPSLGVSQCKDGYVCVSNGCGHVCQKDQSQGSTCGGVLCALYCEKGFQVDQHGCPICRCQH